MSLLYRSRDLQIIAEARSRIASGLARDLRLRTRLTQRHVAEAVGVSQQMVAEWEAGRSVPRDDHALAYGRLLRQMANWAA